MKPNNPHVIIFSVSKSTQPAALNNRDTEMANRVLRSEGLTFIPALGVTNSWGKERSFVVFLKGEYGSKLFKEQYNFVCDLAKRYGQEAILYSDNERDTELRYLSNKSNQRIGTLKPVTKQEAVELGNYTTIGEDRYYAVIP